MMVMTMIQRLQQQLMLNPSQVLADASVLVAITQEDEPKIVLTKRALHLNKHAGEISFAGGKREQSDENNIMVALRESEEEIGLIQNVVQIIGDLPSQTSKYGLTVQPIVAFIPKDYPFIAQVNEIEKVFLIKIQDLLDADILPYRIHYAGQKIRMPSFQLENEVIWGLTGRILVDLMIQVFDYKKEWYQPKIEV